MADRGFLRRAAGWALLALLVIGGGAGAWQITGRLQERADGLLRYVRVDSWTINAAERELQQLVSLAGRHVAGDPAAGAPALHRQAIALRGALELLAARPPEDGIALYADVAATARSALAALAIVESAIAGLADGKGGRAFLATVDATLAAERENLEALAGSVAHTRLQLQDRDIATMLRLVGLNRTLLIAFFGIAGIFTLVLAIEAVVARRAEAAARRSERRVRYLAEHDSLTDLANREVFRETLECWLAAPGEPVALLLIDLDGFKELNDTFGHDAGDLALIAVGGRLRQAAEEGALVARLGGDEFAVLAQSDEALALRQAGKLAQTLQAPLESQGRTHRLEASIGVALAPADASSVDELLKAADLALYAAKAKGRGQIVRFEAPLRASFLRRKAIEAALATAVGSPGLKLVFQPQVDLASGRLTGAETLVRFATPELGPVRPDIFVAMAEQTGHIFALDRWIMEEACRAAMRWRGTLAEAVVAVNLSPVELERTDVMALVQETLARTGLPPHRLELEITEGVLVQDAKAVSAKLEALRRLGIKIAVDDFGTGYSSLAYLSDLPVDKLKLDRAFVRDIEQDQGRREIVLATMRMARGLGLETIAEGIETEAQRRLLNGLGCQEGQGFLWSPGIPHDDLLELADRWPRPSPKKGPKVSAQSGQKKRSSGMATATMTT